MVGVSTAALPPASGVAGCDSLTGRAAPGSRSHFQRDSPSPSWSSCCRQCPGKAQCSFPLAHICCLCLQPSPSQCWLLFGSTWCRTKGPLCFPRPTPLPGIAWLSCSSETLGIKAESAASHPATLPPSADINGSHCRLGYNIANALHQEALKGNFPGQ